MFTCAKYHCTMDERHCIARQEKAFRAAKNERIGKERHQWHDPGCFDCAQGLEINARAVLAQPEPVVIEQKPREEATLKEFKKVCKKCAKEKVASDDPEKSEFYRHKATADGFDNRCKACKSESDRINNAKRLATKRAEKAVPSSAPDDSPTPADRARALAKRVGELASETVCIDFHDYPDLHEKIKDAASGEFRTVAGQILYMIAKLQLVEVPDAKP